MIAAPNAINGAAVHFDVSGLAFIILRFCPPLSAFGNQDQ
jgi:hypothetical protein